MWRNAACMTGLVLIAVVVFLAGELQFLAPYKRGLISRHLPMMGLFLCLLAVNIYAICFYASRLFLLKDTGRKLTHLEKQLRESDLNETMREQLNDEATRS